MLHGNASRRRFLKGAVAGAIAFPHVIPASALGRAGGVAPSDRISIGCIGLGIQGTGNMRQFLRQKDVRIVAVCDVREIQRRKAKEIVDRQAGRMLTRPMRSPCHL